MSDTPESTPHVSDATINRLAAAVEIASRRPWVLIWRSFLQGMMAALGATIGTALFFTMLIWLFQRLGGVELLKPEIQKLQDLVPAKYQDGAQSGYHQVLNDNQLTLR